MAITVRFQNLSHANHEILKTFNSSTAEKALEAYQPLTEKERKLRKLRALQILKESSNSNSLGEISLDNSSLALALKNAEGATLQAMLNLLSAKMIEQNKILINQKAQEIKDKDEEERKAKLEAEKRAWEESQRELLGNEEEEKEAEAEKSLVETIIEDIVGKFEDLKKFTLKTYQNTLDFFTLKRLKQFYDDAIDMIKDFLYRQPREYFETEVIKPIREIPSRIQNYIENNIKESIDRYKRMRIPTSLSFISPATFSNKDLKFILEKSTINKITESKPKAALGNKIDKTLVNQIQIRKFANKKEAIASLHQ
ncbi:MAG: hypothetical protein VKK32_06410 [Candidatus Melainabacteria bacterium]|nr:hypothetical protein [Candidatus Melainabacteria bacterium]